MSNGNSNGGGWNRPASDQPATRKDGAKAPSAMKGVVAGIVVVALGIGCYLIFCGKDGKPVAVEGGKDGGLIKEVTPAAAPKVATVDEIDPELKKRIKVVRSPFTGEMVTITQAVVKLDENASHMGREFPNNKRKPRRALFKTFSENYICGLMRCEPGDTVVGLTLPKNFDEEFIARIADPADIKPEDTEEEIALKQQMVEFKKEMAGLIADGRKPSEVIYEEREKLRKVAEMRNNLMHEMCELKKNGATQAEIDEYVDAANAMLDKEGGKHIKYRINPFAERQAEIENQQSETGGNQ